MTSKSGWGFAWLSDKFTSTTGIIFGQWPGFLHCAQQMNLRLFLSNKPEGRKIVPRKLMVSFFPISIFFPLNSYTINNIFLFPPDNIVCFYCGKSLLIEGRQQQNHRQLNRDRNEEGPMCHQLGPSQRWGSESVGGLSHLSFTRYPQQSWPSLYWVQSITPGAEGERKVSDSWHELQKELMLW